MTFLEVQVRLTNCILRLDLSLAENIYWSECFKPTRHLDEVPIHVGEENIFSLTKNVRGGRKRWTPKPRSDSCNFP